MAGRPDTSARRRALYSDSEREADCARLLGETGRHQIDALLQELDGNGTQVARPGDTYCLGPFGVFSIQSPASSSTESILERDISLIQPDDFIKTNSDLPTESLSVWDEPSILTEQQIVEYGLFGVDQLSPNFGLDALSDFFDRGDHTHRVLENVPFYESSYRESPSNDHETTNISTAANEQTFDLPLTTTLPLHFADDVRSLSPLITQALLAHYRDTMIPSFLSHKHHRSPWKVLHLPCALSAYGEMALLGDTNNAKASLLFAIIAMSALSLEQAQRKELGEPSQWRGVGEAYREKAKLRLQACLREQGAGSKKAKYKEVLMAMLSMVTICVVTGHMEEARCFLLDAERFIYLRGLSKVRKSRKVLMLHGIFLYLRVVEESTCVSTKTSLSSLPKPVYNHISNDGTFSCRYPSLWTERLRLSLKPDTHDNTSLEMQLMAFPVDAEEPTVFEHIYGIPESLFRSISHATYLANLLRRNDNVSNKDLDRNIKALETKICNWKNPYRIMATLGPSKDIDEVEARETLLFDFLEAIHSALMIYFFRRVRDMNTVALQHYVGKTIHHLLEHERRKAERGDTSANFCWPGFIAACEALDPEQRRLISAWLERSARSSGLGMFNTAKDVTSRLWAARGATGNPDMSWQEILANGKTALILS